MIEIQKYIFAYIRVSTQDQNPQRQEQLIEKHYPNQIAQTFTDMTSGKNMQRPAFQQLMQTVRPGDTIVAESFSRIGRNTKELLELFELFEQKNITFISIKENYDFSTPTGKLMRNLLVSIYEFQRELMLERQKEGILLAKKAGKYKGGKVRIKIPNNFDQCFQMYQNRANNYGIKQFMIDTGLKRSNLYKFIREHKAKNKTN